nr:abc transporter g family member 40 [Quercus suber]
METGDLYNAGHSFRRNSSSIWRSGGVEAYSKSSRDEEDEEALKWAALEKLPTFNRLKKGLLTTQEGETSEIDIHNLGHHERKILIDRLLKIPEEDNEKFLLQLRNRIDRVGIDLPTIEVRFEHLSVETETHVGSRALPTLFSFIFNILEDVLSYVHILPSKKKHLSILQDVSGIIKPGRMALLLGPPSSGKTTLLLALAGKLDPTLKFSGRVTYNGHDLCEFIPQRTAAYISQHDLHIAEMTVRETLAFSARCQGVGWRQEMLAELSRREKTANIMPNPDIDIFMKGVATEGQETSIMTDYVLKVLGLEVCADTIVGDQMVRGISGGQKKRVTTVNSIKQNIHILHGTAVISLLQPAPETYDLFDDIILLSDGQIVYQGPREHVLEFFESMGFKCPERKGVADFLQEVTSHKDQKQYWARENEPYSIVTVNEFVEAFQSFHVQRGIQDELAIPFDKSKSHPAALTTQKYGVRNEELLKACFSRELLLMKRNSFVYIFKFTQLTIVALIASTVFLRTNMHRDSVEDGGIYAGALFFSVIITLFNGLAELSMTIARLPVFYKQRDLLFYPPWAYALPGWILKIPISCIEAAVWVFITYYIIGFDPNVGRLFREYLLLALVTQMASALFRFIAAMGRSMVIANTFGSCALLTLFALGGFVLSRGSRKLNGNTGSSSFEVPWVLSTCILVLDRRRGNAFGKPQAIKTEESGSTEHNDRTEEGTQLRQRRNNSIHDTEIEYGDEIRTGSTLSNSSSLVIDTAVEANKSRQKGMVLPFEPHSITFDDIIYFVDMPQEMKNQGVLGDKLVLLEGVSGAFRPGILTALMGVSGAGKTTLMDVLAGRKTGGYTEGNITISGYPKKQETFARICGYCEQNDIHSPHVTVYESLVYSAWLRLSSEVHFETRQMFIEEVMELVELKPLRQAIVGLPGVSGLSTEQRKRLTIAVELVANPSIIFMDEPTSGLDARAAAIVMRTVRNTVVTGRTVVCTIHQPSIDIFEAFDEGIQGVSKINDGYNPATWMLEITSSAHEADLGVDFAQIFKNSELYRRNKALIKELSTPAPNSKDLYFPTKYSRSFFIQCFACLWKQHWSYYRNTHYTAVKVFFTAFVALLFGTMFWDLGSKISKQQDLFNAMGSMYAAVLFLGVQNASTVQPVVAVERVVFYRERAAGMYSALPYAFAQVMIELPYIFVQAVVYGVIVYSMIGFQWTVTKFFWYLFFMYFTLLYYTFYGMMSVAVTPTHQIASIVSAAFYGIWNLFSGFVIPRTRIPVWWRWYYWICPTAWTLYGLVASQFGDLKNTLDTGLTVEDFVESYLGFRHDFLGVVAAVVVGFAVFFAFIFAFAIRTMNFQKR